jgi:hypothetical protein
MSLTPGLQLPFGIQPVNPVPVDSWSGPYEGTSLQDTIELANLAIPIEIRFQSMEVRLIVDGVSKKFWYRDGVTDTDLVEFSSSGSGSSVIITKTKAEIDTLVASNGLIPLSTYEITGVDNTLYGGSTIYVQAINENTLTTDGIGKFFNPKYDQLVSGFNVWTSTGTYSIGDIVHWGGKTWESTGQGTGNFIDIFNLTENDWTIIPFDDTDYNVVYDIIKYDYIYDVIIYRNEQNTNIVSSSVEDTIYWIDYFGYSPIKVFQWGNVYNSATIKGIGNQIITNSYNENINFRGSYQYNINFNNNSYQANLTFDNGSYQQNLTFDNNSYQQNLTFDNGSYQQNLTFDNGSYQQNLTFNNGSYQYNINFNNGPYQQNLTFDNGSYQQNLTFDNFSNQDYLTFDNNSYQYQLCLSQNSSQNTLNFSNGSYQQNLTFDNISNQNYLTFDNDSNQNILTLDNSSQYNLTETTGLIQLNISFNNYQFDRTGTPLIDNEIGLIFNGTLPTSTTATKMIVAESGQWKEMDIAGAPATSFYLQGTTDYSYDTTSSIYRTGSIAIGTSDSSSSKLYVYATQSGAFQLEDGSQGENYILTSGTSGVATWTSSAFITAPISLTYSGLQNLINTNSLELGRRYILANYLHKYQILGSDSGAITQYHTMIGRIAGYVQFVNVPLNVYTGALVTVTYAPPGATVTVGMTFSVDLSGLYNTPQYLLLVPNTAQNSNANFGTIFSFQKQRYPNVPTDSVILDANSKIVMKKGGLINTDVHDGTAYMSMTASQNPVVQTEQLVLTAISENQFSTAAESLTYPGDIVDYRFDNSDILDEDGNSLGVQRTGFIIGRYNNDLNISMDKDWRTQRYRRYKIDSTNWTNVTLTGSSSTLYTLSDSKNYGNVVNTSLDDGHKYLMRFPYESDMYLDFYCDSVAIGTYSYTNTDIFRNGETASVTPQINTGARMESDRSNIYNRLISISFSQISLAFDYPIIPMNGSQPKSLVKKAIISEISNTVFKDLPQLYGNSSDYFIDINTISDSTIGTGTTINSKVGNLSRIRGIDSLTLDNTGDITNVFWSVYGSITNNGTIYNSRFSGYRDGAGGGQNNVLTIEILNSKIYNTIFGSARTDDFRVSNSYINRSMFLMRYSPNVTISGNIYLTSINAPVWLYSTIFNLNNFNIQRQISSTQSKGLYGVKHTISSDVNNLQIDNYNPKLELISKVLDINYGSLTYNIIGVTQ